MDDAAETRIEKLYRIIEESRFSVHDLSRTELDPVNNLPRFNMPLELGIFLGAKRFGDVEQKRKRSLVLDTEQFRYQMFVSDLAGMDITPHQGNPRTMVVRVRNWLATVSRRRSIPSIVIALDSYDRFIAGLPAIVAAAGVGVDELLYADYERLVLAWVQADHGRAVQ